MAYQDDREYAGHHGHDGLGGPGTAPGPGAYYSRPQSSHSHAATSSSHGLTHHDARSQTSPDRNSSSHSHIQQGFGQPLPVTTPQTPLHAHELSHQSSNQGYPATPISGPSYPPDSYYGGNQQSQDDAEGDGSQDGDRSSQPNFTPDGNPIVPVGISGGKMFQCRGYGACDKVFTRSEHLARHVRKHTGERPFPCHCGKAFSRLDNLRQHAATVHSDQGHLNNAMLDSLTPVHSALSARATREQRKRGEIVEVPKNAVERTRQLLEYAARESREGSIMPSTITAAAYPPYADDEAQIWDHDSRPRTSTTSYDYPSTFQGSDHPFIKQEPMAPTPDIGSSRRPGSSASTSYNPYPTYYVGQSSSTRPPTAPDIEHTVQPPKLASLPYAYRSMSATSHAHYAESEPPTSAHGPPESPLYPLQPPVPQPNWSSPPPPHSAYNHSHRPFYPTHQTPSATPDGFTYSDHTPHSYGPPPPGSAGSTYGYPAPTNTGYYGPSHQYIHTPTTSHSGHGHGNGSGHHSGYSVGGPYDSHTHSPFQYQTHHPAPHHSHQQQQQTNIPLPPLLATPTITLPTETPSAYHFPPPSTIPNSASHKRRLDEIDTHHSGISTPNSTSSSAAQYNARKIPRSSLGVMNQPIRALQEINPPGQDDDDQLWFPPTTERRSSLAISALLGSPQEDHKPRLPWDGNIMGGNQGQGAGTGGGDMEEKAKALLGSAH